MCNFFQNLQGIEERVAEIPVPCLIPLAVLRNSFCGLFGSSILVSRRNAECLEAGGGGCMDVDFLAGLGKLLVTP